MGEGFRLFPRQASTLAHQVDWLYFYLIGVSIFFALLIFFLIYIFAVRYRRRSEDEIPREIPGLMKLELTWSIIPLILAMVAFGWGATLYFDTYSPPKNALEMYIVGKQWMWHIQHPTGQREINEMHIPLGEPIKLTMATEDVIHSFYIPAFRVKKDVVPGRYTTMWFKATKAGEYHLFCAEYCGTKHSQMIGKVVVMDPAKYQDWLSGGEANEPLEVLGEKKFQQFACHTCHTDKPGARGPSLVGVYGKPVRLQNGRTVIADEAYLRESILNPNAKIAAGYRPVMPTFKGQITEVDILQITAYLKSLAKSE
ncbi:MAG: cytochrome c oxidase subunit II [Calditrichaeota bacterium]|nr:MAG: cytochrome c oxidase subunit II [Calditrichota bacterium]